MNLEDLSIHAFIDKYKIKTEAGLPLDFKDHMYMFDIYSDLSPKQAIMKAAQITMSTCASIKAPWVAKTRGMDIIYTLPTEADRNTFVGGKINRMIAQNPVLQQWTKDKDSVEQKQIGKSIVHFRGTFTQKSATMVPSDLNIYDEVDASKLSVIEQYGTRLQHSKYKWEWYFSHPSSENTGVHKFWLLSDQKHWFITCPTCKYKQYMRWPDSVDMERQIFVCRNESCRAEISDNTRRRGEWVKKFKEREFSGYWIPLLICPWVSAKDIIGYFNEKTEEYFYNKVLGLPYVGGGNKLTRDLLFQNLTNKPYAPDRDKRVIIGIDTGLKLDYVMGDDTGLFYHGDANDYDMLDDCMKRWPKAIAIIDQGGDLIGSRKFHQRWKGRVFLMAFGGEKKGLQLITWGKNEEYGSASCDRNRLIQLVVDEFRTGRIPLHGTEMDWFEYANDWDNLTRIKVIDQTTEEHKGFKWVRNGRDHRALATALYRAGMDRFSQDTSTHVGKDSSLQFPVAPEANIFSQLDL